MAVSPTPHNLMTTLTIEPTYRVLLGDVRHFCILLVGAGGTGSTLALFLAGLAYHAKQKGISVHLALVDHDLVEYKNCGRQAVSLQAASAGNVPKVADLALRLNAAYGLSIEAVPQKYDLSIAQNWFSQAHNGRSCAYLIIGCVDNHLARREIAQTVERYNGRIWAIECGNEQDNGQVLIGNLTDTSAIKLDKLGLCSGLPSPYIQEPDLLNPDPNQDIQSCAEMMLEETQSLMVNRMAATIAAQLATDFVLHGEIRHFATYFNLIPPTVTSQLITKSSLASFI